MIADIFYELKYIEQELKHILSFYPRKEMVSFSPPVDIFEKNGNIFVYADLPGFKASDLTIYFEGKYLTIKGTKKIDKIGNKGLNFICLERKFGSFERRILLNYEPDIDKIDAVLSRGILKIKIPLKKNAIKKVEIKIREEE